MRAFTSFDQFLFRSFEQFGSLYFATVAQKRPMPHSYCYRKSILQRENTSNKKPKKSGTQGLFTLDSFFFAFWGKEGL